MNIRHTVLMLFLPALCLVLPACAYFTDKMNQDITFVTPGAENAECRVFIDGLKYIIRPPQTVNLIKSGDPMTVDCRAPGNRHVMKYVDSEYAAGSGGRAIMKSGAGLAWDFTSDSIYAYPDVISIDFTGIPIMPEPMPDHESGDIAGKRFVPLEEFLPDTPRLNSDMGSSGSSIQKAPRFRGEDYVSDQPPTPRDLSDVSDQMFPGK